MTIGTIGQLMGASDKLVKLMEHESKISTEDGQVLDEAQTRGVLELKDVTFSYPAKPDSKVLKGISFKVDNLEKKVVALCGTSGCGKSSIISLIERFYDPDSGEILFNGVNIKELNPRWYHQMVAIVQQEPVLFSGTIGENITFGLDLGSELQDEDVTALMDEACKKAQAYDFIHDKDLFPLGYDTVVGERGVKLSGG